MCYLAQLPDTYVICSTCPWTDLLMKCNFTTVGAETERLVHCLSSAFHELVRGIAIACQSSDKSLAAKIAAAVKLHTSHKICPCTCLCMPVCVCTCVTYMYTCMYVSSVYVYMCVFSCTHKYVLTYTWTHAPTYQCFHFWHSSSSSACAQRRQHIVWVRKKPVLSGMCADIREVCGHTRELRMRCVPCTCETWVACCCSPQTFRRFRHWSEMRAKSTDRKGCKRQVAVT